MINEEAIEYNENLKEYMKITDKKLECKFLKENYEALDMANQALEQTTWILCSERLPKIADVYRVTRYYPNNVMNPHYIVDACAFDGSNTWYNDNRINHERAYADNVIAWQENPKPYKGE